MIKIANNLKTLSLLKAANNEESALLENPSVVAALSALAGGGVGAGAFHLLAKKKNRNLTNYLLAASAGALPAGLLGYKVRKSVNLFNQTQGSTPEEESAKSKREAEDNIREAEAALRAKQEAEAAKAQQEGQKPNS
jgi:hypothetical protein